VSIEAGDRAVALMRAAIDRTSRPEVIGGIGGFAGLFDASKLASYRRPLLATSTDGVGTKVVIAQRLGRYDTIGIDLVAMVVDDLVTCGAEPLFMTDYVVFGKLAPERAAAVVAGVAEGCVRAGSAVRRPSILGICPPTISTWQARPPGWWKRTRCSARTGSGSGTSLSGSLRPGCIPMGIRWPGRCSTGPGWNWTPSRPNWAPRSARNC
jgi:phosphoribosylformylglycinamidine cyclo-ligase